MLEILSENRELQATIKEAEKMLTQVDIEKLPSYQLGVEKVARNLLDKLSDDEIAETTGLTLDEIRRLREEVIRRN